MISRECQKCIDQAAGGRFEKTPEEAINCIYISEVTEDELNLLPCCQKDFPTHLGGAGQFQTLTESVFNGIRTSPGGFPRGREVK